MNIAYIRISTIEPDSSEKTKMLNKYDIQRWISENVSAKNSVRPFLRQMLENLSDADRVYITEFNEIASSIKEMVKIFKKIESKNAVLVSCHENMDTSTDSGKIMVKTIEYICEYERRNQLERQRTGIANAKEKGVYNRLKISKPDNWNEVYAAYINGSLKASDSMKQLGLKKNTFYKFVNEKKESM